MTDVVVTTGLTKRYGSVLALDSLDLTIPQGTVFGVIGPNGAGKTTLMRLLVDVLRPTSGSITVLGMEPRAGGKDLRGRIGYLPGEFHVEPGLSGRAHLKFWTSISPGDRTQVHRRAEAMAERLDIPLDRPARKLSKGNKQKLGLVQAFMHRPELLILDEPTSGLDPLVQQTFLELVSEARDGGATVFLSSHVLSEVEQAADLAVVLRSGSIVREASIEGLHTTAVRHLRARLSDADAATVDRRMADVAAGLDVSVEGEDVLVSGLVQGHADDLVKALARFTVADLVLAEPDLEESVLAMYSGKDVP
ncbi:ABC transporter ATP-binding protein [Arthrobacter echini]|uniref:ABC transporter ATP-binding protein n=1 Tax=Arthrobacter echini TaxID=1529066 RepID=A0A4S5E8X9_9MICC|nr:ABC transporter ATP-binding protein [Arthrobacter echini]THJ67973.1 ABC transporter ATP-binding protein [Arthrobacter echini]